MSSQTDSMSFIPPRSSAPDQIRSTVFNRAPLGRRGLDETEVQSFLHRVADELAQRDDEIASLADENRRLKHAMREWHRQQQGFDAADLMARTQQEIEEQLAQAEQYSREREEDAARLYDETMSEALRKAAALAASEGAAGQDAERQPQAMAPEADPSAAAAARERAEARQRAYIQGLLQALDGLAAHVTATRETFSREVAQLDEGGTGRSFELEPQTDGAEVTATQGPVVTDRGRPDRP